MDRRPILVAVAGPNGAGKTTFYHSHLKAAGLRLVNADVIARELNIDPYQAAKLAAAIGEQLVNQRESFAFETVFPDLVGDKISFFQGAIRRGYTTVLCFVGVSSPEISDERVAMRVSQGGHDVPFEKLHSRYPRILKNLKAALAELPHVRVFDNDDLGAPYRLVAICEKGQVKELHPPIPKWLRPLLPKSI
ncbi:MAG TPA: AAA family ATPase [Acidobacteriaceae bacterium]|nr:AAA family ATPase [Acidobacteriaceae bacterium]